MRTERSTSLSRRGSSALAVLSLLVVASCSSGNGSTMGVAQTTTSIAQAAAAVSGGGSGDTTVSSLSQADAESVQQVALAYWAAYNAYQPEDALALLEPDYRRERADQVTSEIGRLRTFGVKLGVSVKTPPHALGPDTAEMEIALKEPLGTRTVVMRERRSGDRWMIYYAEEK